MASNIDGQWLNVGIRVQLHEDPPSRTDILSPDPRFLYYEIDYPLESLSDLMGQLINDGSFTLESNQEGGGAFGRISLRLTRQNSPETTSPIHWYGPIKHESEASKRASGTKRTSIAIGVFGERLHEVLDQDLRVRVDSKLRLAEPGHDGLAGLAEHLFPGSGFANSQQTLVEIVAELPFEIESVGTGKLAFRASARTTDGSLTARCFYEPQMGVKPPRIIFRHDDAKRLDSGMLQWEHTLEWPTGSERAKVTLFYQEEEIQSLPLNRRAELRVARVKGLQALQTQLERGTTVTALLPPSKRLSGAASGRKMLAFKTALDVYRRLEIVGKGGAGVVYRVERDDGQVFAIKRLDAHKATTEKRKRFKVELLFCAKNEHKNIITVLDQGIALIKGEDCPFYVMPYYSATLRDLMKKEIPHGRILPLFSQSLDGVEAAHLKKVWHRDLKPENVLYDAPSESLVVADFGIAHFGEEELYTLVETGAHDRLANFQYAAPEQRARGRLVDHRADIYALGLILNEMFTGHVLQGAGYTRISQVAPEFSYLDEIVDRMVQQSPENRPSSIDEIKQLLLAKNNDFVSRQKLDELRQTVVPSATVTDPFVQNPLKVIDVDIRGDTMVAVLNAIPPPDWLRVFVLPRNVTFIAGTEPANWRFKGKEAMVMGHRSHIDMNAQMILNNFKDYVQSANELYRQHLEETARQREENERRAIREKIAEEERRQKIRSKLTI